MGGIIKAITSKAKCLGWFFLEEKSFTQWWETISCLLEEESKSLTEDILKQKKVDWFALVVDSLKAEVIKNKGSLNKISFYLKYIEGFSCSEIGRLLKIPKYLVFASILEELFDDNDQSLERRFDDLELLEEVLLGESIDRESVLRFEQKITECSDSRAYFNFYQKKISTFREEVKLSKVNLGKFNEKNKSKKVGFFSKISLFS